MCRIEFAEHRSVQPLVWPRSAEFRSVEHGRFPLGDLNPLHSTAHRVLPRNPAIGESLATPQGRWKVATVLGIEAQRKAVEDYLNGGPRDAGAGVS